MTQEQAPDIAQESQEIADGRRVDEFLNDPAVQAAFTRLQGRYVAELLSAQEPDAVLQIHAKLRVLPDIQRELRVARDTGKVAANQREARERREASRRTR